MGRAGRVSPGRTIVRASVLALMLAVFLVAARQASTAQDVTTWHYDMARSGVQADETQLTLANVNPRQFGKVFSLPVIGDVYAQPLYLHQYTMADGRLHNVLIVATAQDYVYAFDADGDNPAQGYLWRESLLGPGETWISDTDVDTVDIDPDIGIIGTPVIDRAGGTIYVVAASKSTSGSPAFYQRLHALNIADGSEKLSGPTLIQATVPGTGNGGATVSFDPRLCNQRAALLLAPTPGVGSGNSVFIAWGSHGDKGSYRGWIMAYDAANIAQPNGVWTDTPNGIGGGIWASGGGLSSDGQGNIFAASGNGPFDANIGGSDYGDTAVRLTLTTSGLHVADSFTPADQLSLDDDDADMGMSAMVLLPAQPGALPHLALTADKSGTIYLLNRDNMGGYGTPDDSSVQDFDGEGKGIHSSAAFFSNTLYLGMDSGPLQSWAFNAQTDRFAPQSATSTIFWRTGYSGGGGTPSISANGTSNGIVWILQNTEYNYGPAILHVYNAANLSQEIYSSEDAPDGRDTAAIAVKFTTPTIANGRVYVGGRNAVTVYGLLSTDAGPTAPLVMQPPAGTYTGAQTVSLTDSTANASIYYTTNGDAASPGSTLYTGPIQVASSETIEAVAVAPGYSESDGAEAAYTIEPPGSSTQVQESVPLGSAANTIGLFNDGAQVQTGGLDGLGDAYSANQVGNSIVLWGIAFELGQAGQKDAVEGAADAVIPLIAGQFDRLELLGSAFNSNQNGVVFTVTYSDGSTAQFTQNMSAWNQPEDHSGESIAYSGTYIDTSSGGSQKEPVYLYRYSFALDSTKTVTSLTLPANSNIAVLAVTLFAY